ncbi:MAG: bestrophin family protein [Candidatus Korobacteraceae bacterium]
MRDHLPLRRVWPHISKRLGALFLFDLTISLLYTHAGFTFLGLSALPLAMMGGAISIFLAFRNNSAYERWWEARKLWGSLVNTARTFARQSLTLVDADPMEEGTDVRHTLVYLQIAYVHALRCHLRRQNPFPELERTLEPELVGWLRRQKNVPIALLLHKGQIIRELYDAGRIDSYRFTTLDSSLTDLCDIQGACERIKGTPLPRQYEYFPRVVVSIYCLLLPLGLVEGLRMITPLASSLISLIFLALESIGKEIENPFENTVHDTPMSSLSRMIEINLRQSLEEEKLPPEVRPVEGFVY